MINFDEYAYFPTLRTRMWELRGYKELSGNDKNRLLPIFTLAKHGRTATSGAVIDVLTKSTEDRAFILDVEPNVIFACDDARSLLDPTDAFANWRSYLRDKPSIVPTALMPAGSPLREIVQQVRNFERDGRQVAIRSRAPSSDVQTITAILSAVDSVDNLLVVLDFGYVRSSVSAKAIEAAEVINDIRNVEPTARIAVIGSSYPRAAAAYDDSGATLEIEERVLHAAIGGASVAVYGDYASIHPEPFEPTPSRFVPRIDYATPNSWIFRRVRDDRGGFAECARRIVALQDWDNTLVGRIWGANKIEAASRGIIDGMGTPGPWIAVRVNLHLWQQLANQDQATGDFDELL
jgi:hypothetical protein